MLNHYTVFKYTVNGEVNYKTFMTNSVIAYNSALAEIIKVADKGSVYAGDPNAMAELGSKMIQVN